MLKTLPFNEHVAEYEDWFERYPFVFQSEVEAREEVPNDLPEIGAYQYSIFLSIRTY